MTFHLTQTMGSVKRPGFLVKLTRHLALIVMLSLVTSCANDPAHKVAMEQAKTGPIEEGVAKLKQSSEDHPESAPYRADYLRERDKAINKLLINASMALGQGNASDAETLYHRVLDIDPVNDQAKMGLLEVARSNKHSDAILQAREAMDRGEYAEARNALRPILMENPKNAEANKLKEEIEVAKFGGRDPSQMPDLSSHFKKPVSMQFRDANLKMILEALSKSSGLNILLDKDVKNDLKATIFVKDASVEDVVSLVLMQNQLEKKVINDTTIYIYPNTPAKVKEYQDLVVRDFHLTNADAKQMLTMLKTVLKSNDIYVNEANNSIVIRDTPDVVELAAKLLAGQDQAVPEVMLEVEVLEVSHNKLMQLGVKYPDQITFAVGSSASGGGVNPTTGAINSSNNGGTTLESLKRISSSQINVFSSAGALSLILDLKKTDGATNILASPRIRVKQNEKAKIHIGDKVPVITNSVTPVSTGTPVVTGSVQYLDVGLKLEVEPDIHMDGDVSIKTALEVSNIASQVTNASSGTIAYQIGTRNVSTVLQLRDGETQVLAGLISANDIESASKIPGLGDLPILGRLFSSHNTNKTKTEIILSITPHIIRNQHQPDAGFSSFSSGTSNAPKSRPLTVQKMDSIKIDGASGGQNNFAPQQFQQVAPVPAIPVNPAAPVTVKPVQPNAVQPIAPQATQQQLSPAQSKVRAGNVSRGFTLPVPRSVVPAEPTPTEAQLPAAAGMTDATLPAPVDATLQPVQ
ncbi:MAG: secretin N-terminal domain-containing protein [Methylophilaceae bacterium]